MKTTSKMSLVLAVLTAAAVVPQTAHAQSASINATANVQVALTVAGTQALSFGAAFPNTTRSILVSDASAGYFTISGANNAEVSMSFPGLPATLTSGANSLAVSFNAAWATTLAGSKTAIASMAAVSPQRLDATAGTLFVFVGGSVSPTTEPAGTYTGTVTLNAAYTGN